MICVFTGLLLAEALRDLPALEDTLDRVVLVLLLLVLSNETRLSLIVVVVAVVVIFKLGGGISSCDSLFTPIDFLYKRNLDIRYYSFINQLIY